MRNNDIFYQCHVQKYMHGFIFITLVTRGPEQISDQIDRNIVCLCSPYQNSDIYERAFSQIFIRVPCWDIIRACVLSLMHFCVILNDLGAIFSLSLLLLLCIMQMFWFSYAAAIFIFSLSPLPSSFSSSSSIVGKSKARLFWAAALNVLNCPMSRISQASYRYMLLLYIYCNVCTRIVIAQFGSSLAIAVVF